MREFQPQGSVLGSIQFRDEVMKLEREGLEIYARQHGSSAPTYRIIPRHANAFEKITVGDLFRSHYPPVYMEDFAQALVAAGNDAPKVDLFTM